VCYLWL